MNCKKLVSGTRIISVVKALIYLKFYMTDTDETCKKRIQDKTKYFFFTGIIFLSKYFLLWKKFSGNFASACFEENTKVKISN